MSKPSDLPTSSAASITDPPGAPPERSQEPPFFVPYLRDPRFTGRDAELARLHDLLKLKTEGPIGARSIIDAGPGGVGVTRLAVEYAYRFRDAYPGGVYWAPVTSGVRGPKSLSEGLNALARCMGLYASPPSYRFHPGIGTSSLLEHLSQRPDALLICEDVDDPETIEASLGRGRAPELSCRVLFTTRRRNPYLRFECVVVGVLSEQAALELLQSSEGGSGSPAAGARLGADSARTLSRTLGHLPLALALAAAYLREHPSISAEAYLTRLTELEDLSVPDAIDDITRGLSARHEVALAAVLQVQREALESPAAQQVLATLAALDCGSHVPRRRIELLTGLSDEAEAGAVSPLGEALLVLRRFELVEEVSGRAVRLHPLIHASALAMTAEPDEIVGDCAARMADVLGDPERLEREVFERGTSEVLLDLSAASALRRPSSDTDGASKMVEHLLSILAASGPVGWERARLPGMLLQHVRNHALFELRDSDLAALAEERLVARRLPYLRVSSKPSGRYAFRGEGLVEVTVTSDGCHAISTTQGGAITFWDLSTGRAVRTLQCPIEWMLGAPALAGGGLACLFASSHLGGRLTVWDLTSNRAAVVLEGRSGEQVLSVAISTNGRHAAALMNTGTVIAWDLTRPEIARTTSVMSEERGRSFHSPREERGLAVTDDGTAVLIALEDGSLAIWCLVHARLIRTVESHDAPVASFAIAQDSRSAVSCSDDGTLKLWDLETCRLTRTLGLVRDPAPGRRYRHRGDFPNAIASVALTADGRFAIAASESRQAGSGEPNDDNALMVWDLSAEQVILKLPSSGWRRNSRCAVTSDGKTLVVTAGAELEMVEWVRGSGAS